MTKHDFHPVICNHTQTKKDKNIATVLHLTVCAVKVKSVDLPVVLCSHSQEKADASKSCNRRVRVIVIYAVDLSKATSYEMCLVFLDCAVCFPLDMVNPF